MAEDGIALTRGRISRQRSEWHESETVHLEKPDSKVADDLNLAWHRLDTWPDTVPGFVRLKRRFMLAPCSNGNIALMVATSRGATIFSGMPF